MFLALALLAPTLDDFPTFPDCNTFNYQDEGVVDIGDTLLLSKMH